MSSSLGFTAPVLGLQAFVAPPDLCGTGDLMEGSVHFQPWLLICHLYKKGRHLASTKGKRWKGKSGTEYPGKPPKLQV